MTDAIPKTDLSDVPAAPLVRVLEATGPGAFKLVVSVGAGDLDAIREETLHCHREVEQEFERLQVSPQVLAVAEARDRATKAAKEAAALEAEFDALNVKWRVDVVAGRDADDQKIDDLRSRAARAKEKAGLLAEAASKAHLDAKAGIRDALIQFVEKRRQVVQAEIEAAEKAATSAMVNPVRRLAMARAKRSGYLEFHNGIAARAAKYSDRI